MLYSQVTAQFVLLISKLCGASMPVTLWKLIFVSIYANIISKSVVTYLG